MGSFANKSWIRILAWATAVLIVGLNARLAWLAVEDWLSASGAWRGIVQALVFPVLAGLSILLLWIMFEPMLPLWRRKFGRAPMALPESVGVALQHTGYRKILVPLDHSDRDRDAVAHAVSMARPDHGKLFLLHVEEGVTSQVYGSMSSTAEVAAGQQYLNDIVDSLQGQGVEVEAVVRHSRDSTGRDRRVCPGASTRPDCDGRARTYRPERSPVWNYD